ncbi:helix-turn-helix transcriptional regulator [Tenacibaculum ovolyticum]|uniref:helix-turn-helix domain-containing protein n=1 Tax=Tenacibaculum ovolyticum TaxID=104270 RepID=UPI0022F39D38|nr:helix-turn-helix transcriptional regulator [Tenacibaculum ovolyticum]WBX78450.1 helix-turn-helix transcriptional regulator [Tenacibaculum ovolyticum]
MSKAQLNRKLHKETGYSPGKLISYYRIESAKRMLSISSSSIEEISFQCGFRGLSSFSRKFKQESGNSPSEYRKNKSNSKTELWAWKTPINENDLTHINLLKKNMCG